MINNNLVNKNNLFHQNKKGFTLVELVIVMGILVLIVALMYSFFGAFGSFFQKNSDNADAQSQSRLIVQALKIDVGTAKDIKIINRASGGVVGVIKPGDVAYYVEDNNEFYKIDGNIGSTNNTFSKMPLESLNISFTPEASNVLKVTIVANGGKPLVTELLAPNITEFDPTGITAAGIVGDAIIITTETGNTN